MTTNIQREQNQVGGRAKATRQQLCISVVFLHTHHPP